MMKSSPSTVLAAALAALGVIGLAAPAHAWIYPEHRDIAVLAVEKLDPERRAQFDRLWRDARTGHEQRLCEKVADSQQGVAPTCIDWAAFPAIAGDHSCSSKNMLDNALKSDWILQVADVAAQLKVDLGRIAVTARPEVNIRSKDVAGDVQRLIEDEALRAERQNALRTSDTRLQRADVEYATRAGSNNAHFLLPRPRTDTTPRQYAELTLSPGSEISAVGVYAWFHLSALQKATRLATETLAPAERQALTRAMLADEGFALHFLEDTYAVGPRCRGLGRRVAAQGHARLLQRGRAGGLHLEGQQRFDGADGRRAHAAGGCGAGGARGDRQPAAGDRPRDRPRSARAGAAHPRGAGRARCLRRLQEQRVRAARSGPCAPPRRPSRRSPTCSARRRCPASARGWGRCRASAPRWGRSSALPAPATARMVDGGYVPSVTDKGAIVGAELSVRAGLGLDGVIGESGDGLVFGSIGLRGDSASTNNQPTSSPALEAAGGVAAVRSRFGIATRLRMPFYLIPGDLLFLSPLYLFSPETYTNMAVSASNGGLIPWQAGWATRIGRFQFVLGRELGATFYGYGIENTMAVPGATPGAEPRVVDFKSIHFDLPILEYRPYRAFDTKQSSAVLIQLFAGADVPQSSNVTWPPGAPGVKLETIYSIGLRVIFDWRRYF